LENEQVESQYGLNDIMINKFIEKNYKQESIIADQDKLILKLQKEIIEIKKLKDDNYHTFEPHKEDPIVITTPKKKISNSFSINSNGANEILKIDIKDVPQNDVSVDKPMDMSEIKKDNQVCDSNNETIKDLGINIETNRESVNIGASQSFETENKKVTLDDNIKIMLGDFEIKINKQLFKEKIEKELIAKKLEGDSSSKLDNDKKKQHTVDYLKHNKRDCCSSNRNTMKNTNKSSNNSLNSSVSSRRSEKESTGGHTVTFSRSPIRINKTATCKTTNQAHLDKYITKKK
jgi:hypothetical protein